MNGRVARRVDRGAVLLVGIAAALWATDIYFRPALTQQLSATQIVFAEDAILCLCFLPTVGRVVREVRSTPRNRWWAFLLIGAGPQALATALFTRALSYAYPANAAPDLNVANEVYLLYLAQPLVALAMAWLLLRERRAPFFWPLAAVAMVGVYLVVFQTDAFSPVGSLPHARLTAALLVAGAVVLWGAGTVLGRYVLKSVSFVTTAAMRFFVALPVLLILLLAERGSSSATGYGIAQLPRLLGLALLPGLVAMLLYYRALRATPASAAALAELAYPAALFLGFSLPPPEGLGAPLHPLAILGAALLIAAITTINLSRARLVAAPRTAPAPAAVGA